MQIVLRLAPVEYRDGFVIAPAHWTPVAEMGPMEITRYSDLQMTILAFTDKYAGTVDAKLMVYGYGRKFKGFDTVRGFPVELHKAPAA
jgi:hypothetical protein